ncbi:hypothetical protein P4O66_002105 [Electrophorus voltai]|uniref:Uncharacterized protein n=1 Tax=Electrophorus voltai TaxID=2609070 RepID=A0AAD8Z3V6_9TELE|nr:hypothetical protein P4O66_002105 [Electrophorus voltai]
MPGKCKKKKGRKGSESPPTARAAESPVFLGTLLTPGAKAGESYGIPVGDRDWYNDFQSSESSVDSYCPAERPSLILASLHGTTGREEPAEQFLGGPVYGPGSDIAESYGEQPSQEDRYLEMDSAGSYDPCLDDYRGYTDYRETEECSDVCLRSDRGSDREEDAPMEVEEDPHRNLPSQSDVSKAPVSKAPPRARHPGARRQPQVASREASSSEEDTPLTKAKSPRVHASTPKPRGGKKAVAPLPAPEPGNAAGALPEAQASKPGQSTLPKLAMDTPQGLAGVPSPFPGLLNVCGVHVPVPVTVPVSITLNVPVTLFPFVSVPVPVSVCVPVSVTILVPVLPPASLFTLARGGLSGPPTLPFGVGLGAAA